MYFVRYHPLKKKLRERSLSDREALPYFILYSVLITVIVGFPTIGEFNQFDMISWGLSVVFTIGGLLYSYEQNGGKEGFDLIQKYVVLGWVVSFRWFLVFLPVIIVIGIIEEALGSSQVNTNGFDVLLLVLIELIIYQRIGRHIRDTRAIASEQAADLSQR